MLEAPRPRTRDPCLLRTQAQSWGSPQVWETGFQDLLGVKRVGSCGPQDREFFQQPAVHRGFEAEKFLVLQF